MTARLSDELATELARHGDQPLPVEDPRTKKLYILVAADEYSATPQPADRRPDDEPWMETTNARRFALIDKEIAGNLTPADAVELDRLQRQLDTYLQRVAPLPLAEMRALHQELLQKSRENGSADGA